MAKWIIEDRVVGGNFGTYPGLRQARGALMNQLLVVDPDTHEYIEASVPGKGLQSIWAVGDGDNYQYHIKFDKEA